MVKRMISNNSPQNRHSIGVPHSSVFSEAPGVVSKYKLNKIISSANSPIAQQLQSHSFQGLIISDLAVSRMLTSRRVLPVFMLVVSTLYLSRKYLVYNVIHVTVLLTTEHNKYVLSLLTSLHYQYTDQYITVSDIQIPTSTSTPGPSRIQSGSSHLVFRTFEPELPAQLQCWQSRVVWRPSPYGAPILSSQPPPKHHTNIAFYLFRNTTKSKIKGPGNNLFLWGFYVLWFLVIFFRFVFAVLLLFTRSNSAETQKMNCSDSVSF